MEGERERETSFDLFSHSPIWGPDQKPRRVPLVGIQPVVTFWFVG